MKNTMPDAAPLELASDGRPAAGRGLETALGPGLAIAAILLVAIDLRPGIVSMGPLLPAIIGDFGLSHAAAALLTTIPDLLMGLLALPTPWLVRRYGRDPVLLLALLLLCASTLLRAFAPTVAWLLLTTTGVGAGIAVAGALIAGFVKAQFPTKAAAVMGLYATALSLGSTVSAGVSGPVAANVAGGWRTGAGLWSLLGIFAILGWLAVALRQRRAGVRTARSNASPPRVPFANRTAWLVALFFACDNFLFYAILSWTAPMFREYGLSPVAAGLVLASFTFSFMCANPVFGWLSRSEDRRGWLAACGLIAVAGLLLLAVAPTAAPFLAVPLCAFGLGGGFTLGMTLPLDNTDSVEEANVWNAFVLTVGYLIAAAGPLLVGTVRDLTGDFRPAMWLLLVVGGIMLLLCPFLRPHHRAASS